MTLIFITSLEHGLSKALCLKHAHAKIREITEELRCNNLPTNATLRTIGS